MEKSLLISNYRRNTTSSFLNFYLSYKRNYLKGGFSLLYYFEYFLGFYIFYIYGSLLFFAIQEFLEEVRPGPSKIIPDPGLSKKVPNHKECGKLNHFYLVMPGDSPNLSMLRPTRMRV